jgi:hypothetical protein
MQRYSGIFMGRRKKPTSETEAEMEGSGDDREPQGLSFLAAEFNKFQQTLNLTEGHLVHHLQENQETNLRGQVEITETLKKVDGNLRKIDENQSRITELLMQMTHQGKDPETYGNKVASGSHGEIRYNSEKAPRSEGSQGRGMSNGQMGSRPNPRPYMPTFTDEQVQQEHVDDFVEQMARCTKSTTVWIW